MNIKANPDAKNVLRVGMNADSPPFGLLKDNELVGMEIDLYKEAAKRMGMELALTNLPFAGLMPGLQARKWDLAGNMWVNKDRLKVMDFADPWVQADIAFAVRKDSGIKKIEDLKGKILGAQTGSADHKWIVDHAKDYGGWEVRTYDRAVDQLMDLQNGRIDAVPRDYTRLLFQIKEMPDLEVAFIAPNTTFMQAVAFRKGDPLRDQFNKVQNEMKKDGTLASIIEKWVGVKPAADAPANKIWTEPLRTELTETSCVRCGGASARSSAPSAEASSRRFDEDCGQSSMTVQAQSVRPLKRRRTFTPWYLRYKFLGGLLLLLIAYAALLPPGTGKPTGAGLILIGLFCLAATAWAVLVSLDREKPTVIGVVGALLFIAAMAWIFYRYSGARWDQVGKWFLNGAVLSRSWPALMFGLKNTVSLFLVSGLITLVVGLVLAIIRSFNNSILNFFIIAYIDVFRSIPQLVLVIVVYYALSFLGVNLDPYSAGVVGLVLSTSPFVTESFRAGIESVGRGQLEAARALGLKSLQVMWLVVLPQAIRVVTPPITGQMIGLIKATAIVSVITLPELLWQAQQVVQAETNSSPLIAATLIYLIILLPLSRLSSLLEARMKRGR